MSRSSESQILGHLREICLALPGTEEVISYGQPAFKAFGRVYTVLEEYNRELSLCVKVGKDLQDVFLKDPRFYRTPYIGQNGWVLLKVYAAPLNWTEVRDLVGGSYQLIAADRWPRTVTKGSARKTLDMVPKTSKAGTAIAARRRLSRPP